jgi:hypothetical protein
MRTRVAAVVTAAITVAFLLAIAGPGASAHPGRGGGGAQITHLLMSPSEIDEGDTPHLTGFVEGLVVGCGPVGLAINWGDGSPVENESQPGNGSFDFPHTYLDNNKPGQPAQDTVTVDGTDRCQGTPHAETTVLVGNVDPQFTSVRFFPRGPRQTTSLDATFTDPGTLDTFTFTVDWGDAAQPEQLLLPAIQEIRIHHVYPEAGGYQVTISIQDDDGGIDAPPAFGVEVPNEQPRILTAPGAGGGPNVKVFDDQGTLLNSFLAFRSSFTGGVRVAMGDVNGDGYDDVIVGAGPGGLPEVRVLSGNGGKLLDDFLAFRSSFTGGVWVAAGDVNGDGFADIVVGADAGGGPLVRVFDGTDQGTLTVSAHFYAFRSSYTGGVRVAVGDVNGDGIPDIVCGAGRGGGPQVKVFHGRTLRPMAAFQAFRSSFSGGVFVAAGDLDGDGQADVVVGAGAGGGPHVRVFSEGPAGLTDSADLFPYRSSFSGGVRVAVGDVNGDGRADIIVAAGAGTGPHVKVLSADPAGGGFGDTLDVFPYRSSFTGGVFVGFGSFPVAP